MAAEYNSVVNRVIDALNPGECEVLVFLTSDLLSGQLAMDARAALVSIATRTSLPRPADTILMELLFHLRRFDILKRIMGKTKEQVEKELRSGGVVSSYRVLMVELSEALGTEELQSILFMLNDKIPKSKVQQIKNLLEVVAVLEQLGEVSDSKLELIEQCVRNIRRNDLLRKIQTYSRACKTSTPSMCETGAQRLEVSRNEYALNYELRGVCVIIDCVGSDGELLKQTFEHLGFLVYPYTLLGLGETGRAFSILTSISQNSILQRAAAFACCLLDTDTDTHASHTQLMEVCVQCATLRDKPKLFFTQRLRSDQYLQTDALPSDLPPRTQPSADDVLWSACETGWRGQGSVYLRVLGSALLEAHERRLQVLEALAEVNRKMLEHNQRNPENSYHVTLTQTLRKTLYL